MSDQARPGPRRKSSNNVTVFRRGNGPQKAGGDDQAPAQPLPLAARMRALRLELEGLEQQQRDDLLRTISMLIGPGVAFSAAELYRHRYVSAELQTAFDDAGITSARKLGKRLRQLQVGPSNLIERIGADHAGALWVCR